MVSDRTKIRLGGLLLAAALIAYACIMYNNYENLINSDDASELVYAHLLAENNSLISKAWMNSAELRILNTQLIFAPLLKLFGSWKLVRIIGGEILLLILVCTYRFALNCTGDAHRSGRFWRSAFLLVMPIGSPWLTLNFKLYYVPYIAIGYIAIGLHMKIVDQLSGKIRRGGATVF